jgi:sec-independent protein translocase protein TatC
MNIDEGFTSDSFTSKVSDLRSRISRSVFFIIIVTAALAPFSAEIYQGISTPLRNLLPAGNTLIATEVTSTFFAPFKLVLYSAFVLSAPHSLYQIWGILSPRLFLEQKKIAIPIFISSIILFYLGMLFAFYIVFPLVFGFFTESTPNGVLYTPDISNYLNMVIKLFTAFGVAFEIPVATVILVVSDIVKLSDLQRQRPYIIVGCFVFGMLLTPPDIISQSLLALPMILLFESGLFMARIISK